MSNFSITSDVGKIPQVSHGFYTRAGGAPENVLTLKQIHSAKVVTATQPWTAENRPEGDAIVTDVPGLAIGIITADCVPVLFASQDGKVIGAAHAGWRGAVGGVLENTIAAMQALGANPENIAVAIGPCIRVGSYEVSEDFKMPFLKQAPENARFFRNVGKSGHCQFNLAGYVTDRLQKAGIQKIYDTGLDTLTLEGAFYSYRRACLRGETDKGRQFSVISIQG